MPPFGFWIAKRRPAPFAAVWAQFRFCNGYSGYGGLLGLGRGLRQRFGGKLDHIHAAGSGRELWRPGETDRSHVPEVVGRDDARLRQGVRDGLAEIVAIAAAMQIAVAGQDGETEAAGKGHAMRLSLDFRQCSALPRSILRGFTLPRPATLAKQEFRLGGRSRSRRRARAVTSRPHRTGRT